MPKAPPNTTSHSASAPSQPIAAGLFAFEGNWESDLSDKATIAPFLQALQEWTELKCIRRDVGTETELRYYIDRWLDGEYADYEIGYFGFHGTAGNLWLEEQRVRLGDLEDMIDGRATGRVIHFSSCSVMRAGTDRLDKFRERTGARAVTGYRKDVDNIEAFAFEFLLLQALSTYRRISAPDNYVWENANGLYERLGFEYHR